MFELAVPLISFFCVVNSMVGTMCSAAAELRHRELSLCQLNIGCGKAIILTMLNKARKLYHKNTQTFRPCPNTWVLCEDHNLTFCVFMKENSASKRYASYWDKHAANLRQFPFFPSSEPGSGPLSWCSIRVR